MKALKALALVVLVSAAFAGGYVVRTTKAAPAPAGRKILYYIDPMHPAYRSDKPGIAPDCGMALEPVFADEPAAAAPVKTKVLYYHDPQDHNYKADKPGLNPETGNTLEPVYADGPAMPAAGAVRISPERQQLIGVKFATVEYSDQSPTVRTTGKVAFDETRITHVHARAEGWIEQVIVDFTGEAVKKGQPMLTIYSPELLASQQELLLAARAKALMASNPLASAAQNGDALFEAATRRLQLWNLTDEQIERVLTTREPIRNVTLYAPAAGVVLERRAFPNQKVTPDMDLYTLADVSRVWIVADVFESDFGSIQMGSTAELSFPYGGPEKVTARVANIQPQVDPMTRTLKVRLDAPNPGLRLKPDMFVNVEFRLGTRKHLTVPAEAVLDTGTRQTVFVDLGEGYLEPRQVEIGERLNGLVVIRSGLTQGERVVASGTFLIDSESQLKAAAGAHRHD